MLWCHRDYINETKCILIFIITLKNCIIMKACDFVLSGIQAL